MITKPTSTSKSSSENFQIDLHSSNHLSLYSLHQITTRKIAAQLIELTANKKPQISNPYLIGFIEEPQTLT